jgi:hypothetical protein
VIKAKMTIPISRFALVEAGRVRLCAKDLICDDEKEQGLRKTALSQVEGKLEYYLNQAAPPLSVDHCISCISCISKDMVDSL